MGRRVQVVGLGWLQPQVVWLKLAVILFIRDRRRTGLDLQLRYRGQRLRRLFKGVFIHRLRHSRGCARISGGATICDEKRMDGTITALLSIAGNAGADIPKVITFMTNAFLMITGDDPRAWQAAAGSPSSQ